MGAATHRNMARFMGRLLVALKSTKESSMLEMSACVQGEGEGEGAVCYGLHFAAARQATCSAPCALVCGTQRSTAWKLM